MPKTPEKIGEVRLVKGYMYRVRTRTGQQKLEREHCMTYLGGNDRGELQFNARPFAGTQALDPATVTSIAPVRMSDGRESPAHYMNRIVR